MSETRNLLNDENGKQTRLKDKLPTQHPPQTFTAMPPEHLSERKGKEEQETIQTQHRFCQVPEDLFEATQAPSAFPVFVQHIPANNSGHAFNELTWWLIEMLDLNIKEPIMLYSLHSPFVKETLKNRAMQHRVVFQD